MRTRAVGLLSVAMVVGGLLIISPGPAGAQSLNDKPFSAYGSGDAEAINALQLGATQVAGLRLAASGGGVNTGGLTAVANEFGQNIVPATPGKNAYGRGSGIEAGLLTPSPQGSDLNQIIASGLAEEFAPPTAPPDPVTKDIALPVNPVLYASLLRGQANAIYDPVYCPVGKPLTYGLGNATNTQLINLTGQTNADGSFTGPLVGTGIGQGTPSGQTTNQSRTVTYLQPNGDGTFAVVSETQQVLAPIAIAAGNGLATGLLITVDGPVGFKVVATGKSTGSSVSYTGNPLITISTVLAGTPTPVQSIHLQDITGPNGLAISVPGVATINLGVPPRAIGSAASPQPAPVDPNGLSASGAVDLLRVQLLTIPGVTAVLDIGQGHMEGAVTAPAGGVTCNVPVKKTASIDPVTVGTDFTFNISIPSDAAFYASLFNCDLVNITATDTAAPQPGDGNPQIQFVSADHGGVVGPSNTVTWADVGSYGLGSPPIVLTINARIPASSPAGTLVDTVKVTANLGNCRGGTAIGEDIIQGSAKLNGSAVTGTFTLVGPQVSRGNLAATGGNSWPLVAGGGFLLAAFGLIRLRRRASDSTSGASTT